MKSVIKKSKALLSILLVAITIFVMLPANMSVLAAAPKGSVKSIENVSSGIKINWYKDSNASGYYVYRKAGSASKWSKVKTITKKATTSWIDTKKTNGSKYVYKVCSYKGKNENKNSVTKTIYRLNKPTITISRADETSIIVKTNSNSKATGYYICYSTSSDFSGSKGVYVTGTSLNKKITGLTRGKKYYVKVRAYKVVSGKNYYSAYSDKKSLVTYFTAYISNVTVTVYDTPDSNTDNKTKIRYMTKITVYEAVKTYSSGSYRKIKYNGDYYYMWIAAGTTKYTRTKNPYNYENAASNEYAQALIDNAVYIFKNWKTKYVHDMSDGVMDTDGKYGFDCSGFVSYCLNSTMNEYCPPYFVNKNIEKLGMTTVILNDGYSSEFSTKTVCEGKCDFNVIQPGDIIFFDVPDGTDQPCGWNHCGIYLGDKQFIHATIGNDGVEIMLLAGFYEEGFVKAMRFVPESGFTPINEVKTSNVYMTLYEDSALKNSIASISKYDEVTLLYTLHTRVYSTAERQAAYIRLADGTEGYIYYDSDISTRLS